MSCVGLSSCGLCDCSLLTFASPMGLLDALNGVCPGGQVYYLKG
nr:MAG TPA: CC domain protein [Caudoviricetes sp.]